MLWMHVTKSPPACVYQSGLFAHIPMGNVHSLTTAILVNEKNQIFSNFAVFFFYFLRRKKLLFPLFESLLFGKFYVMPVGCLPLRYLSFCY